MKSLYVSKYILDILTVFMKNLIFYINNSNTVINNFKKFLIFSRLVF